MKCNYKLYDVIQILNEIILINVKPWMTRFECNCIGENKSIISQGLLAETSRYRFSLSHSYIHLYYFQDL